MDRLHHRTARHGLLKLRGTVLTLCGIEIGIITRRLLFEVCSSAQQVSPVRTRDKGYSHTAHATLAFLTSTSASSASPTTPEKKVHQKEAEVLPSASLIMAEAINGQTTDYVFPTMK